MELWVIIIITVILVIVLFSSLEHLNKKVFPTKELIEFSSKITYPVTNNTPIFIENIQSCHPHALQTCKVNDSASCMSCTSFSQCVNFKVDSEAIQTDGTKIKIPATKEGEGWCLPIINKNIKCNEDHGKRLIKQSSKDLWTISCECTRPGYIGNDDLSQSCETVHVCNGEVQLPLAPWSEIKCKCPEGYQSVRIDDVPTCTPTTITSYEYKSLPTKTVSADKYDITYTHNIKSSVLPNPCITCAITGKPVNGELRTDNTGNSYCVGLDNTCLAIRLQPPNPLTGKNSRVLKGTTGPDAVISLKWSKLIMYGTKTNNMKYVILFEPNENIEIADRLELQKNMKWAIKMDEVHFPEHFVSNVNVNKVPRSVCLDLGYPRGMCQLSMSDGTSYHGFHLKTVDINNIEPVDAPPIFVAGSQTWNTWESWNPIAGLETGKDVEDGKVIADRLVLNPKIHLTNEWTRHVKVLYLVYNGNTKELNYIRTNDINDWSRYVGAV